MARKIEIFVVMLLIITVMCSCMIQKETEKTSLKAELVFAYQYDNTNTIKSIVEDFNNKNEDIRVRIMELSTFTEENYRILSSLLSSDEMKIDVFLCEDIWNRDFIERGYVSDLKPYININTNEYPKYILNTLTIEDKLYGIPFMLDVGVMAYRDDLVPKKNNFRQFVVEDGYSFVYSDPEDMLCVVRECIQLTGDIKSGLELYKKLYTTSTDKESDKTKYIRTWTTQLETIRSTMGGDKGIVRATPLITDEKGQSFSVARLHSVMVNATLPHEKQQAVKKFLEYMSLDDTQKVVMKGMGSIPVKYKYFNDNKILDFNEYNVEFKEIIGDLKCRFSTERYMPNSVKIYDKIYRYLNGEISVNEVEDEMKSLLQNEE